MTYRVGHHPPPSGADGARGAHPRKATPRGGGGGGGGDGGDPRDRSGFDRESASAGRQCSAAVVVGRCRSRVPSSQSSRSAALVMARLLLQVVLVISAGSLVLAGQYCGLCRVVRSEGKGGRPERHAGLGTERRGRLNSVRGAVFPIEYRARLALWSRL